jgi:hypothetical protein
MPCISWYDQLQQCIDMLSSFAFLLQVLETYEQMWFSRTQPIVQHRIQKKKSEKSGGCSFLFQP